MVLGTSVKNVSGLIKSASFNTAIYNKNTHISS